MENNMLPSIPTIEEENVATERTHLLRQHQQQQQAEMLLLPSPSSTDLPSMANLPISLSLQSLLSLHREVETEDTGLTDDFESPLLIEVQLAPLVNSERSSGRGETKSTYALKDQRRDAPTGRRLSKRYLGSAVFCAVALLAFIWRSGSWYAHWRQHQHETPTGPGAPELTSVAFSTLDPVSDLGLPPFGREPDTAPPANLFSTRHSKAFPTNAWYQNLLLVRGEPDLQQRAYSLPFVFDVSGPVPGLRLHPNHIDATQTLVQLSLVEQYALTLGADADFTDSTLFNPVLTHTYKVVNTNALGVTLEWNSGSMFSSIVRGMPYATMTYPSLRLPGPNGLILLPTIASEIALRTDPLIDGNVTFRCPASYSQHTSSVVVNNRMELSFHESDFTWLIFFSRPVKIQCRGGTDTWIQITSAGDVSTASMDDSLIVRMALVDVCTTGLNPIFCRNKKSAEQVQAYRNVIERFAHVYPGQNTTVKFAVQDDKDTATLTFDWNVQTMRRTATITAVPATTTKQLIRETTARQDVNHNSNNNNGDGDDIAEDLIMFALPHHLDRFNSSSWWDDSPSDQQPHQHCMPSLIGSACLIKGRVWTLQEELPLTSFVAPRLPAPEFIESIAAALKEDITYQMPDYYARGAGDTYFSGKMLAKLGRILIVAEQLEDLCQSPSSNGDPYASACANSTLPSDQDVQRALDMLRSATEVWINGKAETPFVYDTGWGGMVSCGCYFDHGACLNKFPDCPAFFDTGLNFGNGFYNDMHFHYGYMIYAAAVVAHFDPSWGRNYFEQVLLLVRSIANPSEQDVHFPTFRHKDWFQGSSWASGIALPYLNGKNQESSSESIHSYEAVALFGTAMTSAWQEVKATDKVAKAKAIREVGRLLAATEVRSAKRYWHVQREPATRVYPVEYAPRVVGIMWSISVQFQTWFGLSEYLAYGIQLLPLTVISEDRDSQDWVQEMYPPFAASCESNLACTESGWSVSQLAMLATAGHADLAAARTLQLSPDVFSSAGGNGHSRTNTLWYIATRPAVSHPVSLVNADAAAAPSGNVNPQSVLEQLTDCHRPDTCTDQVLSTLASTYTCRERIVWLIQGMRRSQLEACTQVAGIEYPNECGGCNPVGNVSAQVPSSTDAANNATAAASVDNDDDKSLLAVNSTTPSQDNCPPCNPEECSSSALNRCPAYRSTFVCTAGSSRGGCAGAPWELDGKDCAACCELTSCQMRNPAMLSNGTFTASKSPDCPPCRKDICQAKWNQCPLDWAPFLCTRGASARGCSPEPWTLSQKICEECCEVTPGCDE